MSTISLMQQRAGGKRRSAQAEKRHTEPHIMWRRAAYQNEFHVCRGAANRKENPQEPQPTSPTHRHPPHQTTRPPCQGPPHLTGPEGRDITAATKSRPKCHRSTEATTENRGPDSQPSPKQPNQHTKTPHPKPPPQPTTPNTPLVFCLQVKVPLFGHVWAVCQKHRAHGGWPGRQTTKQPNPPNRPTSPKQAETTNPGHSTYAFLLRGKEARNHLVRGSEWFQKERRKGNELRAGHKGKGGEGHPNTTQNTTNKPQPRGEKWPA